MKTDFPNYLDLPANEVAPKLLGSFLECDVDGERVIVRIVETESYDESDEASHSFRGKTQRTEVMFGSSGRMYVYFTYGMHYCCNVVTGPEGVGSAVLIRAVEPVKNGELLEFRRNISGVNATNGPAKLCRALNIDKNLNGHDLRKSPVKLIQGSLKPGEEIVTTTRIGISCAKNELRRFYIKNNPYVSKK